MLNVSINLVQRIREEFEEVPRVRFTVAEAARFWGLDETTCEQVFAQLLAAGFLASCGDERFGPSAAIVSAGFAPMTLMPPPAGDPVGQCL